jgi:hypothetical protein
MLASLPPPLPDTARVLFGGILEELVKFTTLIQVAGYFRDPMPEAYTSVLIQAVDWLTHKCSQFEGLALLASQAFCRLPEQPLPNVPQDRLPAPLRKMHAYYNQLNSPSVSKKHPASHEQKDALSGDTASASAGRMADDTAHAGGAAPTAVVCPPGGQAGGGPDAGAPGGVSPVTLPATAEASQNDFPSTDGSILEKLVIADVRLRFSGSSELARALQALCLRLLSEPSFKRAFAACYTTLYRHLAIQHFQTPLPEEESLFSSQVRKRANRQNRLSHFVLALPRVPISYHIPPSAPGALLVIRVGGKPVSPRPRCPGKRASFPRRSSKHSPSALPLHISPYLEPVHPTQARPAS